VVVLLSYLPTMAIVSSDRFRRPRKRSQLLSAKPRRRAKRCQLHWQTLRISGSQPDEGFVLCGRAQPQRRE
jgi:hypothetical protein